MAPTSVQRTLDAWTLPRLPRRPCRLPRPPGRPATALHRSAAIAHRVLGGVAAGIARTYGIDVSLVRVLWVIAGVFWIGIPAYVVAWIAIRARRRRRQ